MTNAEKQALLRDLAGIRTVLDSAMLQLKNLELRLGPPSGSVSNAGSPQERPADSLLQHLRCHKCGSPMQWRFARATGTWFAGCESFRALSCRGSMSYERVMERPVDRDEAWQRAQDDADREAQYDHANAAASPES